ncbi:leucine-rich repeat transmembrane protein FLRT3-like [Spodoptera frugiperda]|uniref:Leucine-rich repeat transmembrane protein FLRT3-like n=1 Tax=Spodoptera frugiperda TaxID=7108 RepID=A0A9R0DJ96_SPOFR|nr:leucine-rich repeat transmembrane protein FLRT3-like [Spodoptera frugiperda]
MESCKLLSFSAFFVLIFGVKLSMTQVDVGIDTTSPDPLSTTICTTCACADGAVNCVNLNLTTFFEIPDWDGLKDFKPLSVNLSHNAITHISRISKLPIRELNLSSCEIQTIEDGSFIYLEDLRVLDLSNNKISTSAINKKVFAGPLGILGPMNFKTMQYLSLANNDLHSLAQDLFLFMPDLLYLDLSDNPLAFIDQVTMGAISDLKYLRELRLSNCELETLPDGLLRRQRKLRRLDISNNRFTTIPAVLKEAPSLVYLNLDRTPIQTLDSNTALGNLTKLQELSLSRLSRLQNVSAGALAGLGDLVILRMNYNPRLTNLDPDFLVWKNEDDEELWPNLRELYLNNNNLSSIDSGILDNWKELMAADFSINPFICDCKNQWVVDVLVPLLVAMSANTTINNMVCKKPAELKGLTFAQLNEGSKTLVCMEAESIAEAQVSNMAIILGIMIGIVVTFPMVLVLVLLWRRGFFSKLRGGKPDYDEEAEDL